MMIVYSGPALTVAVEGVLNVVTDLDNLVGPNADLPCEAGQVPGAADSNQKQPTIWYRYQLQKGIPGATAGSGVERCERCA